MLTGRIPEQKQVICFYPINLNKFIHRKKSFVLNISMDLYFLRKILKYLENVLVSLSCISSVKPYLTPEETEAWNHASEPFLLNYPSCIQLLQLSKGFTKSLTMQRPVPLRETQSEAAYFSDLRFTLSSLTVAVSCSLLLPMLFFLPG